MIVFLLLAALHLAPPGVPVRVTFVTEYPLDVWVHRSVEGWEYLGPTGVPLSFLVNPADPTPQFLFLPEGTLPQSGQGSVGIPVGHLASGRWPPTGRLAVPLPPAVQIRLFLRYRWPVLLALGLGLAALGWLAHRTRRSYRAQLSRARRLEGMTPGHPLEASRVGNWRLVEGIGQGGMGVVYRAIPDADLDESRAVAVKLLHGRHAGDEELRARFRGEIQVWMGLEHPGLGRLLDFGDEDGVLYLVMELHEGQVLSRRIGPGLPPDLARDYLLQAAEALLYLHERGVVHRDVKPSNLFCCTNGRLKLLDFGLARRLELPGLTASGAAMGTAEYMAPEQILGGQVGPWSDQYSLGVTAYQMLSGRLPFQGEDAMAIAFQHLSTTPEPLSEAPPELAAAVLRMLSKDPPDRFPSLKELLEALR